MERKKKKRESERRARRAEGPAGVPGQAREVKRRVVAERGGRSADHR